MWSGMLPCYKLRKVVYASHRDSWLPLLDLERDNRIMVVVLVVELDGCDADECGDCGWSLCTPKPK